MDNKTEWTTDAGKIREEINDIQTFLEQNISDESQLPQYGEDLAVWLARTTVLMADAKYILDQRKSDLMDILILEKKNEKMAPSIFKEYVSAKCREENRIFMHAERLNRACTHRMDWIRSRLSFFKAQINM